MFSFAIWDNNNRELFLARDRLGKKPLYYYEQGNDIAFASEIKALLSLPWIDKDIRPDAVYDFFTYYSCNGPSLSAF